MVSHKKEVYPTVKLLLQIFPEKLIRETARETRAFKRERKIDSVILYWVFEYTTLIATVRSITS
ncbi:MAG: hypothetical protein ACT6FF_08070 [Methanosarcinaceae archaeon]